MRRETWNIAAGAFGVILSFSTFLFSFIVSAHAALRVAPAVVNVETFPHGEEYVTVSVINETSRTFRVAPLVGEFDAQNGTVTISGTPYDANSLVSANIELPREDFNVAPGASRSLTAKINVSPYLPAGTYHAVIAFAGEFYEPGKGIVLPAGTPYALVNVTVRKDIRERLNLTLFRPLRKVFLRFPASLSMTVNNGGNVSIVPDANVRFFDRRDREQGSVDVRVPPEGIGAGEEAQIPVTWEGRNGFGRYRAQLELTYGVANGGQLLAASATFWVLPVWLLALLALLMVVLSYGAARMIVRSSRPRHDA